MAGKRAEEGQSVTETIATGVVQCSKESATKTRRRCGLKIKRPRSCTNVRTVTRKRDSRRKKREKALIASALESLGVQHDTSELIVVGGDMDGKRCRDVLIDAGASSNFVSRSWACSQRLRIQELAKPLDVTLADGRLIGRVMGGVVVSNMSVQGSSAPCTLVVMEELSHHVILGMPWLKKARVKLAFDDAITWNGKPLFVMKTRDSRRAQLLALKVATEFEKVMAPILKAHQAAFSKDLPRRSVATMKNAIKCQIRLKDPNCRPRVSRERRRSPKDTQILIEAVKEMEAAGLIQKSTSPWSSQPVLVNKVRDGVVLDEKRPCWDYRGPNECIESDAHPLPLPEDMFDKLQGCCFFSKLDLTKGFWQIPLEEASKKILAMATPLGLYEPNCMPFGMKNAPAVFQREMQRVLRDKLYKGVMVFIDDILIYSKTAEEHAVLVKWVLQRLQEEGYYVQPDKSSTTLAKHYAC